MFQIGFWVFSKWVKGQNVTLPYVFNGEPFIYIAQLSNLGLMDANGVWTLEPFYNFTYAESSNGWHALSSASIIREN